MPKHADNEGTKITLKNVNFTIDELINGVKYEAMVSVLPKMKNYYLINNKNFHRPKSQGAVCI